VFTLPCSVYILFGGIFVLLLVGKKFLNYNNCCVGSFATIITDCIPDRFQIDYSVGLGPGVVLTALCLCIIRFHYTTFCYVK
jgi:hypothetical protein